MHPSSDSVNAMGRRSSLSEFRALAMIVMAAALCGIASAQAGCTAMVLNLSSCISYITSNMAAPPATCCTQLDNIVQTEVACLCMFLLNGSPFRIALNQTQVLSLPGACNIMAGPLSQCNGVTSPIAPGPAPFSSATPAPATPAIYPLPGVPSSTSPSVPSGSASKTVPGGTLRSQPLFFGLLIAITWHITGVAGLV